MARSKLASFDVRLLPMASLPAVAFACLRWLKGSRWAGENQALELSAWNTTKTCIAVHVWCECRRLRMMLLHA